MALRLRRRASSNSLGTRKGRGELVSARFLLLATGAAAVLAGCGGQSGPVCHPVRGQVQLDGRPLADAQVVFHPALGAPAISKPFAQTDSQGNFSLTTVQSGDGAPAGEYAITVELRELRQVGEEVVRDGRNMLPARFANPQESGLRHVVVEGDNVVPTLQVSARQGS